MTPPVLRPPVRMVGVSQERERTSEVLWYVCRVFQVERRLSRSRIPWLVPRAIVSGFWSGDVGEVDEHHIVVGSFGFKLTLRVCWLVTYVRLWLFHSF